MSLRVGVRPSLLVRYALASSSDSTVSSFVVRFLHPGAVSKIALNLSHYGRRCIGYELDTMVAIESLQRFGEADAPNLDQIFSKL